MEGRRVSLGLPFILFRGLLFGFIQSFCIRRSPFPLLTIRWFHTGQPAAAAAAVLLACSLRVKEGIGGPHITEAPSPLLRVFLVEIPWVLAALVAASVACCLPLGPSTWAALVYEQHQRYQLIIGVPYVLKGLRRGPHRVQSGACVLDVLPGLCM